MEDNKIIVPEYLKNEYISFAGSDWNNGIGGIHTREKAMSIDSRNKDFLVMNFDVGAYYPSLILNLSLGPRNADRRRRFLKAFREIVKQRMTAKKTGDKKTSDALKVPINATTGKLNDKYSPIYNPVDYVRLTVSGQLYMLKLAEDLFNAHPGIRIKSANTDGLVAVVPGDGESKALRAAGLWAKKYNFSLDTEYFRFICARDVNNYFALTRDLEFKRKGIYSVRTTGNKEGYNNPRARVCHLAIMEFVKTGKSMEEFIRAHENPYDFMLIQRVSTGAKWKEKPVGKVVRFWWVKDGAPLLRINNGYKVNSSDGCEPVMLAPGRSAEGKNKLR